MGKEDEADATRALLKAMLTSGTVEIEPGANARDVQAFLHQGWFRVYIKEQPQGAKISANALKVDMTVRHVEVTGVDDETTCRPMSVAEIVSCVARQDYKFIKIIADKGTRATISD